MLDIKGATATTARVALKSAKWKGLRLSAELTNAVGLTADLRTKAADATSSVLAAEQRNRSVPTDGVLSLLVERDDLIGSAVLLVLADATGAIVFKHPLNIGEN